MSGARAAFLLCLAAASAACQRRPVDLAQPDRAAANEGPSTQPPADSRQAPPADRWVAALREVDGMTLTAHPGDQPPGQGINCTLV